MQVYRPQQRTFRMQVTPELSLSQIDVYNCRGPIHIVMSNGTSNV